ncbi:uncharacterized protein LOC118264800 [Spodoptera frugiperda]|uniref:Uncharacterized protein LOC118264800 n=1 Tax=Spodoptera frugiperda TaxID=7108 RepID=A0A9R0CYB5_SPOFR|nr:uncharacterized protein LOC118264800 [Spodoptera frugiperda]
MEVSNYLRKFKLLLDYVFEGKVVLNENTTEKLLKLLEDRSDNSPGKLVLDTPCFSDLIFNSLESIHNATTSVKIFLFEIITILFKNELQFAKIHGSIFTCILANLSTKNRGLNLACIKLATVQITHLSGLKLLLEHKVWQYILNDNTHRAPIKIANASYNFISKLILELNEYEMEAELSEVLDYVVKPINTSAYQTVKIIDNETDTILSEKIYSYMYALLNVLQTMEDRSVNHVVQMLRSYFLVERSIFVIWKVTRYPNLLKLANDIIFVFYYSSHRHNLFNGKTQEFCNELVVFYHNCVQRCIKKREISVLVDYCIKCNIFWSKFEKTYQDKISFPLYFERNGIKFLVSDQVFVFLVQPLLMCAIDIKPGRTNVEKQEFMDKFLTKIGKTLAEHIFTLCYTYKPVIETQDLTETAISTIREMYRLRDHLTQTQAGLYFIALYHILDIYILLDGAGGLIVNDNPIKTPNDMRLLSLALDAIRMLLKDYNISWYENVEIASLQEGLMNLLKQDILNTKQTVQVLDLIDLCMKKFLSPNMTLLVESRQESTLTVIGAVMKTYIHHEDWEVRDSALNLLLSCTDLSFIKYIPLQKVISENNLMIYAAKAALTDPEYYVQCTGLKCLAAATKIDCIWKEVLIDNPHIYFQLVYILKNNPEGMVRKEATKVLTSAYKNQKLSTTFQSTLYEVMISAALYDLHWEVQLAALQFFKHEIANQLSYRGMIDGKFPSVTFSKEKRKIITLNDREILRQLTAIMHALSSIGCLTVLYECMNEMHHLEVMEQAYIMATELIQILDQYKFVRIIDNALTYPIGPKNDDRDEEMALDLTRANNTDAREKVIDSIVNTDQSELIMILHDNSFQTKTNEMEEDYSLFVQRKEIIHPNKFLETFKGTNFRAIIKEKKKWNSDVNHNLDGLLDEILDV